MSGFDCACARLIHEFPCASDVAQAPSGESQIRARRNFGVRTKAELGFAVSLGIVDSQRLFAMRPRLLKIPLPEESRTQNSMRGPNDLTSVPVDDKFLVLIAFGSITCIASI